MLKLELIKNLEGFKLKICSISVVYELKGAHPSQNSNNKKKNFEIFGFLWFKCKN